MHSKLGSLAQLVQSICLTSRGSGVRTPQLPQRNPQRKLGIFYLERLGEKPGPTIRSLCRAKLLLSRGKPLNSHNRNPQRKLGIFYLEQLGEKFMPSEAFAESR